MGEKQSCWCGGGCGCWWLWGGAEDAGADGEEKYKQTNPFRMLVEEKMIEK